MILDIYKDCFERIYIFSPSISVDHTWQPVKKYISEKIMKSDDEPEFYYDTYDPDSLDKIIDNQKKIDVHIVYVGQKMTNFQKLWYLKLENFCCQSRLLRCHFTAKLYNLGWCSKALHMHKDGSFHLKPCLLDLW